MNLRRKHALTVAVAGHQAQARLPAPSTDRDPCCHAGDAADCGRQDSAAASEPFLFIGVLSQHDSAGESQRLKAQRRCKGTELDDVMCQPVQHTACVCSVLESADSNTVCLEVSLLTQAMGRCQSHSPYLCRCPCPSVPACRSAPKREPDRLLSPHLQHTQSPLHDQCPAASLPSRQAVRIIWAGAAPRPQITFAACHESAPCEPYLQATQSPSLTRRLPHKLIGPACSPRQAVRTTWVAVA